MATKYVYHFSHLTFRQTEYDRYLHEPNGELGKYLRKRGIAIVAAAKKQVGVDTGALRASIRLIHERSLRGQNMRIGSSLPYALMHHEGTKPHEIVPKDQEFMRFTSKGRVVYSRKVMHPGTKPNKYLTDQLWIVKSL